MHWKFKAGIQRCIAALPDPLSHQLYYWVQRRFGNLRHADPRRRLRAGLDTWTRLQRQGYPPEGKTFFELGTGRAPIVPLAYWLLGAEGTITLDRNPYLRWDFVRAHLHWIATHGTEIRALFGARLHSDRFEALLAWIRRPRKRLIDFLHLCRIAYIAPGDGARLPLRDRSVDVYTSYTVLEHIPPEILQSILEEGTRVIRDDGFFVQFVDYGDHFSYSDPRIDPIHFLGYDEETWARYAGNRYMYMNRLRHDDMTALFTASGHRILETEVFRDPRAQRRLQRGKDLLDARFRRKPQAILSITGSWFLTRRAPSG